MRSWGGALLLTLTAAATPALPQIRQEGSLTYDGIPALSDYSGELLTRFSKARTAFFQDWLNDGSMLILTRFGNVDQVHQVAGPGLARTQLTFGEDPVRGALARPRSNQFLFARDDGGNEMFQAFLGDSGADAVQVTEPGTRNEAFVFSHSGNWLAWSRLTPGQADADVMLMRSDDPASPRVIFHGKGTVSSVDITDDARLVLVEQRNSATRNQYLVIDTATGKATRLLPKLDEGAFRNGRFLDGGRRIALTLVGEDGFRRFAVLDVGTGVLTYPAGKTKWDVELFDVAPDEHRVALSTNEDGFSRITEIDLEGRAAPRAVPVPEGMIFRLAYSPDGKRLGIGLSTSMGGDVWSWDGENRIVRWTYSELGGVSEVNLARPKLVRFATFDKRMIPAFVYRAAAPTPGRHPVIIAIHGGPEAQERTWFNPQYQYWSAALGAVVVAPNVRGSTGYGKAYLQLDDGLKREDAVRDIGAVLDWIATQPDLDPKRVVVYGESYGGFMSLASLAAYSSRLAGAIDVVGISNFATFLENTEGYRRDRRRAEYGDERLPKMRSFFDRISPLANTDKMRKPLLVVAGANDIRVPLSESCAIVQKVRASGGEAWLLIAADEGHGFQKRANQMAQERVQTRFLRHVFGLESQ